MNSNQPEPEASPLDPPAPDDVADIARLQEPQDNGRSLANLAKPNRSWGWALGLLWRLPAVGLIAIARFYQICLSPLLPAVCRFTPTCSSYFIQSVQKYGAVKGSFKGAMRICRCHPWGGHGHDPP